MDHNGHGINLYGVVMNLMGILHAGGQSDLGHLSLLHRPNIKTIVVTHYLCPDDSDWSNLYQKCTMTKVYRVFQIKGVRSSYNLHLSRQLAVLLCT